MKLLDYREFVRGDLHRAIECGDRAGSGPMRNRDFRFRCKADDQSDQVNGRSGSDPAVA